MTKWLLAASIAAALGVSTGARAGEVTYDFEDAPLAAATPLTLTEQGLSATFTGSADPDAFEVSYNTAGTQGPTYATFSGAFLTVGGGFGAAGSSLTIAFDSAIRSIRLLFALDDHANTSALAIASDTGLAGSAGGSIGPGYFYPEGSLTLAGDPFSSVTLTSDALDFSIDGIVVETAPLAVPEPASLLLALTFLPALALRRRRA